MIEGVVAGGRDVLGRRAVKRERRFVGGRVEI